MKQSKFLRQTYPITYRCGLSNMALFLGGYASLNGTVATFHYYTQDYLGNNRAVINGSTGAIEQTIAYYPYGGVIADLGTTATSGQLGGQFPTPPHADKR